MFANAGLFGITLFFVTSGALMAQLAATSDPSRFLLHRVVRIYPTYLIVAVALLAFAPLLGNGASFDPWALALIPGPSHAYSLGIEWTLPLEITFYLIVFACMLAGLGRRMHIVGALWAAIILVVHFGWPQLQSNWQFPTLTSIPIVPSAIGFAAGLAIPWVVRRAGDLACAAPFVGLPMLAANLFDPLHEAWWYAAACCCFVAAAMTRIAVRAPPIAPLAKLGDWSYGLYLCHVTTIVTILRLAPADVPSWRVWAIALGISIVVGSVVGMLDLRLYAFLRQRVDRTPTTWRWRLSLVFVALYSMAGMAWANWSP